MANRFWVGGGSTTDWSATANTNWAATSGGAGNQSVPGSADDVFFDAASGAGTAKIDAGFAGSIKSFDSTGFTGTHNFNSQTLTIVGGAANNVCKFDTTHTGPTNGTLSFTITAAKTTSLTTNGKAVDFINMSGSAATGGTLQLQDALTINASMSPNGGTLDTNGKTVVAGGQINIGTGTSHGSVLFGASSITAATQFSFQGDGTVNAGTSTITLNGGAATFSGGGATYYDVVMSGTGTAVITGSNTFHSLSRTPTNRTLNFTAGTTTTITTTSSSWNGAAGLLNVYQSTSAGTAWNLSIASGIFTADYVSLKDSHAAGGAEFRATHATDVSGNTGWIFATVFVTVSATQGQTATRGASTLTSIRTASQGQTATRGVTTLSNIRSASQNQTSTRGVTTLSNTRSATQGQSSSVRRTITNIRSTSVHAAIIGPPRIISLTAVRNNVQSLTAARGNDLALTSSNG